MKYSKEQIEKVLVENWVEIARQFQETQSDILTTLYQRYSDLEKANIVLYFSCAVHEAVLNLRKVNLQADISYQNFWHNHESLKAIHHKIIKIANDTGLPKETARRKIEELRKAKIIHKDKQKLYWNPPEELRKTYDATTQSQTKAIANLIALVANRVHFVQSSSAVQQELMKHYSFYWYHFLNTELMFMKYWQNKIKDIELYLIGINCTILLNKHLKKKDVKSMQDVIAKREKVDIDIQDVNISATSISEITGIPRATCIRKLEKLVKFKLLKKDSKSKRYYVNLSDYGSTSSLLASPQNAKDMVNIFANFYWIVLNALDQGIEGIKV